jgi:hypothetical protein
MSLYSHIDLDIREVGHIVVHPKVQLQNLTNAL